jgi:uncharacterized Zn finger protein
VSVSEKAIRLLVAGRVRVLTADAHSLTATVVGDHGEYEVEVRGRETTCSCPARRPLCSHATAVGLVAGWRGESS